MNAINNHFNKTFSIPIATLNETQKNYITAKFICGIASVVFGIYSLNALLVLSPIKATVFLGCSYACHKMTELLHKSLLNYKKSENIPN